jgi:hypothetical protein
MLRMLHMLTTRNAHVGKSVDLRNNAPCVTKYLLGNEPVVREPQQQYTAVQANIRKLRLVRGLAALGKTLLVRSSFIGYAPKVRHVFPNGDMEARRRTVLRG